MLTTLCKQWFKEQGIEAPATITKETAEAILGAHNLSILMPLFNFSEPSDAYPGYTNHWLNTDVACQMFRQKNFIAIFKDRAHPDYQQIWHHMFSTTIPEDCGSNINFAALFGNLPLFKKLTTYGRQRFNLWLSPLPTNWSNQTYLDAVRSGNLQLVQFMEEKHSFYPDKIRLCLYAGLSGKTSMIKHVRKIIGKAYNYDDHAKHLISSAITSGNTKAAQTAIDLSSQQMDDYVQDNSHQDPNPWKLVIHDTLPNAYQSGNQAMVDMVVELLIRIATPTTIDMVFLKKQFLHSVNHLINADHPDQSLVDSAITDIKDWVSSEQAQGSFLSTGNRYDKRWWQRVYGHILFCIKFNQIETLKVMIEGITNDDKITWSLRYLWVEIEALRVIAAREAQENASHQPMG